ncbi:MAG TPA: hypothetical protein VGG12_02975 [Methylovirgula sp.]|jgi:hypothetical protein
MGDLVEFKPNVHASRPVMAAGATAEILFFTGVRIVRLEGAETPQGDPQQPAPRAGLRKRRRRAS